MKELMLVFANILDEETIINEIEKAVQEYKDSTDKSEARIKIETYGMLLTSKSAIGKDDRGLEGMMEKFDRAEKASKLLDTTKG